MWLSLKPRSMVLQEKTDSTTYQSTYAFLPWEGMKNSDPILETRPHMGVGGGKKWIFLLCFLHSLSLKASAWATGFQGFLRQKKKKKKVAIFFSGVTDGKMLPQNDPCSWVLFLFRSLLKIHWLLEPPGLKLPLPHYPLSFLQKI